MHPSSYDKMTAFRRDYLEARKSEPLVIVDLGSQDFNGSYRPLFAQPPWKYIGVDLAPGNNVDVVLADPYDWRELEPESADVVVAGQTFEHTEFFWETIRQIARTLKRDGLCCIIVPSSGPEHRFPIDCWRMYPDGLRGIARYAGLQVLEARTQWEDLPEYDNESNKWHDSILIARKSLVKSEEMRAPGFQGAHPAKPESNPLADLAAAAYGTDPNRKPDIYLNEYHRLFQPFREQPIRFLELGVHQGKSMMVWEKYFPSGTVVGIDTEPKPTSFPANERFHFVQGAQDDPAVLDQAIALAKGPFDVILDDCSHLGCHTARTFAYLFRKGLVPGGIYIIEDICTAFSSCNGADAAPFDPPKIGLPGMPHEFPSHRHGMVGLIKQLLDHSQAPTAAGKYTEYPIERLTVMTNLAIVFKAKEA